MKRIIFIISILLLCCSLVHAEAWREFAGYQGGPDKEALDQVFTNMHRASAAERADMETGLIGVLNNPESMLEAKRFACRFLREIGSVTSVDALSKLLRDPDLSMHARYALEGMAYPEVDAALRQALDDVAEDLKAGILASVANRRDAAALERVTAYAARGQDDVARAALRAMGKIGTPESVRQLMELRVRDALSDARMEALLDGADQLIGDGKGRDAVPVLEAVWTSGSPRQRGAALNGWLSGDSARGVELVVAQIGQDDPVLREAALSLISYAGDEALTRALCEALPGWPVEVQASVVTLVGHRGDPAAASALLPLLKAEDETLKNAAVLAVGRTGNADVLDPLLELADAGYSPALEAIACIKDPRTDALLVEAMAGRRHTLSAMDAARRRGALSAADEMARMTADSDPAVRREAWNGVAALAQVQQLDALMTALNGITDKREKAMAAKSIQAAFVRMPAGEEKMRKVKTHYDKGDEATRMLILDLVAASGDDESLRMVQGAMETGTPAFRSYATQRLFNWPATNAAPAVLDIARAATSSTYRIQALRSYIRLAGVAKDWKVKAGMYRTAAGLATRVEEKNLIISGLLDNRSGEAFALLDSYMKEAEVREVAETTALQTLSKMRANERMPHAGMLQRLAAEGSSEDIRQRAAKLLPAAGTDN